MKKILIVDDAFIHHIITEKILKKDYLVTSAKSGREALEILKGDSSFDLIFLDLMMAGMDGWALFGELRKIDSLKNIPVIVVSASIFESDIVKAGELGVKAFIRKPFNEAELLKAVTGVLGEGCDKG